MLTQEGPEIADMRSHHVYFAARDYACPSGDVRECQVRDATTDQLTLAVANSDEVIILERASLLRLSLAPIPGDPNRDLIVLRADFHLEGDKVKYAVPNGLPA